MTFNDQTEDRMGDTPSGELISSSDVTGTAVYSPSGDHIGDIDHLMIDKVSGRIGWAVMGFGGFLGLGEDHMPIPWGKLTYDTGRGGYTTDITSEDLHAMPPREDDWSRDRDWEMRAYSQFGLPYYWI